MMMIFISIIMIIFISIIMMSFSNGDDYDDGGYN